LGLVVAGLASPAGAQERRLSDQLIEQLATGLARVADRASPRPVAYFGAEPPPHVRAYLEAEGIEVVLGAPTGAGAPPGGPPPASTPPPPAPGYGVPPGGPPYGIVGMHAPDTRRLIQDFLTGVREVAGSLPPDGPLAVEGFTVDLPGGSVHFRLR
jgi:hypothetical protein